LEAIKAEGGITFAQDDSARYNSMPRSAVAAGCVDFVLAPAQIAQELARIATHPHVVGHPLPATGESQEAEAPDDAGRAATQDGLNKILVLLRKHSGVDFSLYRPSTLQRRISRRILLSKLDTPEQYARFLQGNPQELEKLYGDALISVTSFFRNPEAFDALQTRVLPTLLAQRGDEPLRIWVPGCSTGQEAYSIAMALVEATENRPRPRKIQVFATDLNDTSLGRARQGTYARTLVHDLSPERLRRFFVEDSGSYRVGKLLRDMVVFARQNLISDPPFSRLDLITCRNLLIYLEPGSQKKLFPMLHYALKPGGFLWLGASESIGAFTDLFEAVDKKHKIYVRKPASAPALALQGSKQRHERAAAGAPRAALQAPNLWAEPQEPAEGFRTEANAQREADRVTVNQFAPPGVLIDDELQILQFRGATGTYLAPPVGKASFDVLKMARDGLMLPLRSAIREARQNNQTVHLDNVRVEQEGAVRLTDVQVIPLRNLRERCFLILFEGPGSGGRHAPAVALQPAEPPPAGTPGKTGSEQARRVAELENELAETREYLQSIEEQYEAANEELQATNEEVQSANEELQSLNEELETSKEELESSNEELTTVNEELAHRNAELNRISNDLVNVQTSAHQVILVLDRDLKIRRFSAQAEKQLNLLASDLGRPIGNIRIHVAPVDLEPFITEVIDTVRAQEAEVQDKDGHWFSLRVRPYITLDNKVDGAVLLLLDIDTLKRSEHALRESEARYRTLYASMDEGYCVIELLFDPGGNAVDYRFVEVNAAFETQTACATRLANGYSSWCPVSNRTGSCCMARLQTPASRCASCMKPARWEAAGSTFMRSGSAQRAPRRWRSCSGTSPTAGATRPCCARPTTTRTSFWRCWRTNCATRWRRCAARSRSCAGRLPTNRGCWHRAPAARSSLRWT
jgi:two-component system, chemotaxis family, CheB/CheR fusion protein